MPTRQVFRIFIFLSVFVSTVSVAAVGSNAAAFFPNFIDPGRVGQQIQQSVPSKPKLTPQPQLPKYSEPATKEGKIHFKLSKVVFKGNTVYSQKELEQIFKSSLNHDVSLVDLQGLVHDITTKYRTDGYILSRAILPPQVIKNGLVQIQIIEGFISDVEVKGDPGRAKALLEAYGKHIMQVRPLQINTLERYALLANDLPGYSVKMVINPSKNVPGGADLTFVTARKVASAYMAYDDYGTRYIGPNEVSLGASLYSILAPGDNNTLRLATTSRMREMQYAEFDHAQPLGTKGLRLLVGANYNQTKPAFVLTPAEIVGRNTLIFGDLSYPWIRDRDKNIVFHLGFNYQNVISTLLGSPFYQDRIRSMVLGGTFDNVDHWHGVNSLGLDMVQGFSIMGADPHVEQSRINGQTTYTRFVLSASRLQGLTQRFSLYGAFKGQYSFESLLATEQFGAGGSEYGRGYDPSEIVGDRGVSGKLELRMDTAPELRLLQSVQYYAFFDAGEIWNIDTVNLPAKQDLTAAGIGARFSFIPQVTGNLYLAKPLSKKVSTLVILGENPNQARIFFQIVASV